MDSEKEKRDSSAGAVMGCSHNKPCITPVIIGSKIMWVCSVCSAYTEYDGRRFGSNYVRERQYILSRNCTHHWMVVRCRENVDTEDLGFDMRCTRCSFTLPCNHETMLPDKGYEGKDCEHKMVHASSPVTSDELDWMRCAECKLYIPQVVDYRDCTHEWVFQVICGVETEFVMHCKVCKYQLPAKATTPRLPHRGLHSTMCITCGLVAEREHEPLEGRFMRERTLLSGELLTGTPSAITLLVFLDRLTELSSTTDHTAIAAANALQTVLVWLSGGGDEVNGLPSVRDIRMMADKYSKGLYRK